MNVSGPRNLPTLVLLLCAAACQPADMAGSDAPEIGLKRREAAKVRAVPVVQREMLRVTSTTTNVESVNEIDVFPRTAGVVVEVLAEEGDRVEAGTLLAILDQRDAVASLQDSKVALREAQNSIPRLELAAKEAEARSMRAKLAWQLAVRELQRNEQAGLLSEIDLDKLRLSRDTGERDFESSKLAAEGVKHDLLTTATTIERAQLLVEQKELALSYTEIRAPFAGIVAQRMVKEGNALNATAAAFTLTDPENLRAVVYRPQRELAFFQLAGGEGNIDIRVRPDALPGQVYEGHLLFISPTIDAASGSFRVTVGLEQPPEEAAKPRLLPGMLIRLDIVTDRHPNAMVVPKRALRREGDSYFLFAVREERAVRVSVREGLSDDQYVEVLPLGAPTLEFEDQVVVVGNRDLEDGSAVRVEASSQEDPLDGAHGSSE